VKSAKGSLFGPSADARVLKAPVLIVRRVTVRVKCLHYLPGTSGSAPDRLQSPREEFGRLVELSFLSAHNQGGERDTMEPILSDSVEDKTMEPTLRDRDKEMAFSDKNWVLFVYILYFCGFFFLAPALIGVIIAHIKAKSASALYRSHFRYQINTFWIGLLILIVGVVLSIVLVGVLVLAWFLVWTLIRCIKGTIRLSEDRPIENPAALLW